MEQEFVSYEQAVALKELGFNEICMGYFDVRSEHQIVNLYFTEIKGYHKSVSAFSPLKQQVFRWFRYNYFLDSEIYLQEEQGHKFYHYLVLQLVRGNIEWKTRNITKFKTYEEAENACIDKLIELAKQ